MNASRHRTVCAQRLLRTLLLCLGVVVCSPLYSAETYENREKGFGFTIPDGWVQGAEGEANAVVLIYVPSNKFRENINVLVGETTREEREQLEKEFPWEEYKQSTKKLLPAGARVIFKKPERTIVGGHPGWKLGYICDLDKLDFFSVGWVVIVDQQYYMITWTYTADTVHREQVDAIIKSFTFARE